jgi:DNA-binding transcriptional LysR family regulator
MGFAATPTMFSLRSDDFVVQVRAAMAGYGVGFLADYTVRDNPAMVKLLPQQLHIPALPMWLAVHREIRTNARIRAVYDFLAQALPELV